MEEHLLRYANFETSNNHAIVPCGLKSLNGRIILSSQHYVDRLIGNQCSRFILFTWVVVNNP